MLNNKNTKVLVAAALILFVAGTAAQAATLTTSGLESGPVTRSIVHPLAPQQITQNTDPNTIVPGTVACGSGGVTTENEWSRLFDLDLGHNLTGEFCVENVDYAIETATDNGVAQNLDIETACLADGSPYLSVFLTDFVSTTNPQADAEQEFFNVAAPGTCCDSATESLVVALDAPLDCTVAGCGALYVGSNDLGQSAPTYLKSASCGAVDAVDLADLGPFGDIHLLLVVNGDGTDGGDDGGDDGGQGDDGGDDVVPASNGIGIALMLVLLLGSSAYFMRRRATN